MLRIVQSSKGRGRKHPRIGLAIAGGGPLGAIYELGVLRALEETLEGVEFADMDAYVGVSAGAFIAAGLANGLSPAQMCRIFINSDAPEHPFKPELFLKPAFSEYWRSAARLPKAIMRSVRELLKHPMDLSFSETMGYLSSVVPAGFFDNNRIEAFIRDIFSVPGRSNDFRELQGKLFLVAVDLDTGASIRFGAPGHDHVPISRAIEASAALPGLYPPVEIDGRFYLDGALRRTLHASVALEEGVDLLIALNPLVPYDSRGVTQPQELGHSTIMDGGLLTVLSQTFRAMIQSRMQIGIQKYQSEYPNTDLVLLEPDRNDALMFFTNVFSYSSRHELCEHAYQVARSDLRSQLEDLAPIFERHGITVRTDLLEDPDRRFTTGLLDHIRSKSPVANRLHRTLDQLERSIQAPDGTKRAS